MQPLKSILIQYANERGGGLPLTPEEVCNAVVLWCQNYLREKYPTIEAGDKVHVEKVVVDEQAQYTVTITSQDCKDIVDSVVDSFYLGDLLEGSESIIVDVNEAGNAIEIHLDSELLAKIERAILLPLQAPQVPSIPVVGVNNAVEYAPITDFTSGGSKIYKHVISGALSTSGINLDVYWYSRSNTPTTMANFMTSNMNKASTNKLNLGLLLDSSLYTAILGFTQNGESTYHCTFITPVGTIEQATVNFVSKQSTVTEI